jgi:hypothetical protein
VLAANVRPAGKLPVNIDQFKGDVPPVAVNVWLYDVPAVAPGNVVVVTVGATLTTIVNA